MNAADAEFFEQSSQEDRKRGTWRKKYATEINRVTFANKSAYVEHINSCLPDYEIYNENDDTTAAAAAAAAEKGNRLTREQVSSLVAADFRALNGNGNAKKKINYNNKPKKKENNKKKD